MIIYAAGVGYKSEDVRPFLASLRATGYMGALSFWSDGEAASECRRHGWEPRPPGPATLTKPHANRFLWMADDVKDESDDVVMCLDARDVIFQRDPATSISCDEYVYCCEEDRSQTLGSCPYNSEWLRVGYGENVARFLGDEAILCVGSFFGPIEQMSAALGRLSAEIRRIQPRTNQYQDQAAWNWLAYAKAFPRIMVNNESSPVYTVGYIQRETVKVVDGTIRNLAGDIPVVVHQWDRHRNLTEYVRTKYAV